MLLAAFGGMLPPVIGDGLNDPQGAAPLFVDAGLAGWSLNLQRQGQCACRSAAGAAECARARCGLVA